MRRFKVIKDFYGSDWTKVECDEVLVEKDEKLYNKNGKYICVVNSYNCKEFCEEIKEEPSGNVRVIREAVSLPPITKIEFLSKFGKPCSIEIERDGFILSMGDNNSSFLSIDVMKEVAEHLNEMIKQFEK